MDDGFFMRGHRGAQLLAAAVIVVAAALGITGDPSRALGQDGRGAAPVIEGTIQATENEYVGEALAVNAADLRNRARDMEIMNALVSALTERGFEISRGARGTLTFGYHEDDAEPKQKATTIELKGGSGKGNRAELRHRVSPRDGETSAKSSGGPRHEMLWVKVQDRDDNVLWECEVTYKRLSTNRADVVSALTSLVAENVGGTVRLRAFSR